MTNTKIDWRFKFLYFIAIISVIIGHGAGGISLFYDWFTPYAFHLPLFVFSSGYFYKESSTDNVSKYIIHKLKTLIIPLYLWNIFYGLIVMFSKNFGFAIGEDFTLYNLLIAPILDGRLQFRYNLGGWFIVPLFLTQVINVLIRKTLSKLHINEYVMFVFYLILGLIGVYLGNIGLNTGLWLVLNRVLRILPYYELGIIYKNKLEEKDKIPNIIYFSLIVLIQIVIITLNGGNQITLDLDSCSVSYRLLITPYIVSFLGIAFWLRISNILLPVIKESKCIKIVCDNAYSIMINQFAGFMLVKTIWACVYKYTSFNIAFDMTEYKSNIWYYYNPNSNFAILYLISGIVVPIIMQLVVNKIKSFLKNKD